MDKALLLFGSLMIIFGIIISYLLITSILNLGMSIADQYSNLPQVQRNKINASTLIGAAIVLIGVLIVRKAFKR